MTTDNKTLADVQPGGRVRLGDQAERARFEAWVKNHVSSLARAADGEYASNFTHALWSAWRAALAARQPVETQLGYTLSDVHEAYSRGKRDAERQPVGNYEIQTENGPLKCSLAVYAEWQKNEEYIARLEEELKSARQQVGEPVVTAEMLAAADKYHDSDEYRSGNFSDSHTNAACYRAMAAAAPPAQAVDLGLQLDRYDAGLLGNGGGGDVNWWQDYIRAELDRAHEFYQEQADAHG
ncbi:hypothetical protein AAGG42_08240 [Stenotrophomonas maltophilia]|uniref:hypothetical protein n=1 Tax=Stenotrophomonas maltophilia TaxID=40324 RepID=UPI0031451C3A